MVTIFSSKNLLATLLRLYWGETWMSFQKQNNINSNSQGKPKWYDCQSYSVTCVPFPNITRHDLPGYVLLLCIGIRTLPLESIYVLAAWRIGVRLVIGGCMSGVSSKPHKIRKIFPRPRNHTLNAQYVFVKERTRTLLT